MRFIFLLIAICLYSCSHDQKTTGDNDIFERIIHVHKTGTMQSLVDTFGPPQEKLPEEDKKLTEYKYEQFSTSVDEQSGKVIGTSMPYWVNYDAYAYLKKRFKDFKWIETELPPRTKLDYAEEIHKVEIPELGIKFEYDNQDPLRRPMWIFFK